MIETTPEGFNILIGKKGVKQFMVDSSRLAESIDYLKKHDLRFIGINSFLGYTSSNLDFLLTLADFVEGISIPERNFDLAVLNKLKRLTFLGFADDGKTEVDLSNFPDLSVLACEWTPRLQSLESCEELRELTLTNYRPQHGTVSDLPALTSLKSLSLFQTGIVTVEGIGRFPNLEGLDLFKASKLNSLDGMVEIERSLKSLELDGCRRISGYDALAVLGNLRRLIISKSAPIASLGFVKSLYSLEFFSFVGTNIIDGDLSPCVGLDYVGFDDRNHYSHKFVQFRSSEP